MEFDEQMNYDNDDDLADFGSGDITGPDDELDEEAFNKAMAEDL